MADAQTPSTTRTTIDAVREYKRDGWTEEQVYAELVSRSLKPQYRSKLMREYRTYAWPALEFETPAQPQATSAPADIAIAPLEPAPKRRGRKARSSDNGNSVAEGSERVDGCATYIGGVTRPVRPRRTPSHIANDAAVPSKRRRTACTSSKVRTRAITTVCDRTDVFRLHHNQTLHSEPLDIEHDCVSEGDVGVEIAAEVGIGEMTLALPTYRPKFRYPQRPAWTYQEDDDDDIMEQQDHKVQEDCMDQHEHQVHDDGATEQQIIERSIPNGGNDIGAIASASTYDGVQNGSSASSSANVQRREDIARTDQQHAMSTPTQHLGGGRAKPNWVCEILSGGCD